MPLEDKATTSFEQNACSTCGRSQTPACQDECQDECYTCKLEKRLVEADMELQRLRIAETWLRHIQQSVATRGWQTAGDFYRGKYVFMPQDLLTAMDAVLDPPQVAVAECEETL